jgi:hypothetical protein
VSAKLGEPEHHAKDAEKAKASDMVSKSAKPAMPSAAAFWYVRRLIMDDPPRRNGHSRPDKILTSI